jgi:hypothetical protein
MTIKELPLIYNVDKVAVYNKRGIVSSFWRNSRLSLAEQVQYNRTQLIGANNILNEKIESMGICVSGISENVVTLEIYLK